MINFIHCVRRFAPALPLRGTSLWEDGLHEATDTVLTQHHNQPISTVWASTRNLFRLHLNNRRDLSKVQGQLTMGQRLLELKRYCMGWFHYFKIGLPYGEVREWDGWIRRRIRLCYWKDWKLPRKRRRMLIKLGISPEEVKKASRARKGYWRMSRNSLVSIALNNTYLTKQGVPSIRELWVRFKYGDKARV